MSDNEIYLLIAYIKSVLWRAAKRLSYIEDARCLKVNLSVGRGIMSGCYRSTRNVLTRDRKIGGVGEVTSCMLSSG